jgi:hypothetical protein
MPFHNVACPASLRKPFSRDNRDFRDKSDRDSRDGRGGIAGRGGEPAGWDNRDFRDKSDRDNRDGRDKRAVWHTVLPGGLLPSFPVLIRLTGTIFSRFE